MADPTPLEAPQTPGSASKILSKKYTSLDNLLKSSQKSSTFPSPSWHVIFLLFEYLSASPTIFL